MIANEMSLFPSSVLSADCHQNENEGLITWNLLIAEVTYMPFYSIFRIPASALFRGFLPASTHMLFFSSLHSKDGCTYTFQGNRQACMFKCAHATNTNYFKAIVYSEPGMTIITIESPPSGLCAQNFRQTRQQRRWCCRDWIDWLWEA